jgi:hypothetical protein
MFEKFGIEMLQKTFLKYEDLNLNYMRITNLSIPMDKNDAVNLFHIMGMFEKFNIKVNEKIDTELQKTFLRVRQFFNENAITAQYFHENAITFAKNIKYISLKDKFRFTSCGAIPDKFEADTLVPARYVLCQEKDDKNANYTAKNKRIINVSDPVDDKDAVNKGFFKEYS